LLIIILFITVFNINILDLKKKILIILIIFNLFILTFNFKSFIISFILLSPLASSVLNTLKDFIISSFISSLFISSPLKDKKIKK
jgi:hypothetical protein